LPEKESAQVAVGFGDANLVAGQVETGDRHIEVFFGFRVVAAQHQQLAEAAVAAPDQVPVVQRFGSFERSR
jgi:hypothetical protein